MYQIDQMKLDAVLIMNLESGSHESIEKGLCVMEAVAYVAGERWSDKPQCACPIIAAFLRSWNDRLPDDERQQLKQYIPLLVGSKSTPEVERMRSWMLTDWVVRDATPRWLRRAGMEDKAALLEALSPIGGSDDYAKVRPALEAIREETWPRRMAFRAKVKEAFQKHLPKIKAATDAVAATAAATDAATDAVAAAAAEAVAAAAADAAADAVADVVADIVAATAAEAVAAAAADAAADAVADAVAVAAADAVAYWPTYWKVRNAIFKAIKKVVREKLGDTYAESQASAHRMVKRLLDAGL